MTYTLERAEEMARGLRELPPMDASKRKLTKQAVVRHLAAEIEGLQKRGYTIEQIVEGLRGVGLDISTPTLKSYLQRSKAKPNRSGRSKTKHATVAKTGPSRETAPTSAGTGEPKADGFVERRGKQAFLVRDKDSY